MVKLYAETFELGVPRNGAPARGAVDNHSSDLADACGPAYSRGLPGMARGSPPNATKRPADPAEFPGERKRPSKPDGSPGKTGDAPCTEVGLDSSQGNAEIDG